MPANNIDLYGKYIANTYSIVFMVDGNKYKTVQKEYKEVVGTISNPTKKDSHLIIGIQTTLIRKPLFQKPCL